MKRIYPLVPPNPKKNDKIFAYVRIDSKNGENIYNIIEPKITKEDKEKIEQIKEYIKEKLDVDFRQVKKKTAEEYLSDIFNKSTSYFKLRGNTEKKDIYKYYVFRDFIGLGKIQPIMNDPNLEDISCDGVNVPIYVYHRNPKLASIKTNVSFKTKDELDSFVRKMAERCGKTISVADPLLNASLPDGSRVQATLETDIARRGSNFTIRKFTDKPITPVDIINFESSDIKTMAFFWFAVEYGTSFLISGGTATGKTSLLNAIALFIRPDMKVVSIEDTAEIRLLHEHWVPEVARVSMSEKEEVDLYKLLRESLRQRPDYIIVGEVRGREAFVLFQQFAVGHPGIATIHAENASKLFDRLTSEPISLPPTLLENLDLIVFLKRVRRGNRYIRKIKNVMEIVGFSKKNQEPFVNEIIEWDPKKDDFISKKNSSVINNIIKNTELDEEDVRNEIKARATVLRWLVENKVNNYKEISKIIKMFYSNKEALMKKIGVAL